MNNDPYAPIECYFCHVFILPGSWNWLNCQSCVKKFSQHGATGVWTTGDVDESNFKYKSLGKRIVLAWDHQSRSFRFNWSLRDSKGVLGRQLSQYELKYFLHLDSFPRGDIGQMINKLNTYILFS